MVSNELMLLKLLSISTGLKPSIIPSLYSRDVVSSEATMSSAVALVSTFDVKPTGVKLSFIPSFNRRDVVSWL